MLKAIALWVCMCGSPKEVYKAIVFVKKVLHRQAQQWQERVTALQWMFSYERFGSKNGSWRNSLPLGAKDVCPKELINHPSKESILRDNRMKYKHLSMKYLNSTEFYRSVDQL